MKRDSDRQAPANTMPSVASRPMQRLSKLSRMDADIADLQFASSVESFHNPLGERCSATPLKTALSVFSHSRAV